jgi:DNA polymerase III subunit delta
MVRVPVAAPSTCKDGGVTRGTPGALHLVVGDEEFLAERAVNEVVAAARAADPDTVVTEHRAADTTPAQFDNAVAPSLFGGGRIVVLLAAQDTKKELAAALQAYVANPDPDLTLIVTHAGGAKGKAVADAIKAAGAEVVTAAKLTKHRERVDFIRAEVRRLGGTCPEAAADALLTAVGNELRDIAAACAQLVADTDGRIDSATIARYYRGRAEVSGFTVADAAMVGDVRGALEALRWAMYVGVDPVPIADALADGVRTVARVAGAGRGNAYQLASSLGMPPWKVERAQRQARGWTADGLVDAMHVAAECNAAVKGGADDRGYALERAVMAVAAARAGSDR